ncbi:MAG: hypothetical protein FWG44_07050 [Oscillospiraceae bacterium]|nr:hypothetical protein [Oscillospiraceae bacterium]
MKQAKIILLALIITAAVALTVMLAGCGEAEPAEDSKEPQAVNENQEKEEQNPSSTPEPLNLETDFIYLNITPEEADEIFGEPLTVSNDEFSGFNLITHTYEGVSCVFRTFENEEPRLINLWVLAEGFAPIHGIEVGDSFDSVLSKIELGEDDNIIYSNEMYYYVLSDDMTFFNNSNDTYIGTTVSFSNWGDSYSIKGELDIDFNENDEVYFIRIIINY